VKICGSHTNLQQFYNGFGLQGKPLRQSVIVVEFITEDLQCFIDWYVSEETDNVKANESIWRLKVDFNNCTKWPEFLTKDYDFPTRGLRILCRKPDRM
jgi:hypothetical protein